MQKATIITEAGDIVALDADQARHLVAVGAAQFTDQALDAPADEESSAPAQRPKAPRGKKPVDEPDEKDTSDADPAPAGS